MPVCYDLLATKNQHIPPRYLSLVKMGIHLADEDAISLLMDEYGYYPHSIALCGSESIWWK